MIHISLFSGILGFEIAAEMAGWKNYASCEIDDFGHKIASYYLPNGYHHRDIKTLTYKLLNNELKKRFGKNWRNEPVIITGGFPCQPFSYAGRRKGTEDNRYLWPEMLRFISEVRPTWVVGENVAGIASMVQSGDEFTVESQSDLFQKNNKETLHIQPYVIETICKDFERIGYSIQPFLIPACAVGAPHRRDRVWFVAYSGSIRPECRRKSNRKKQNKEVGEGLFFEPIRFGEKRIITDTASKQSEYMQLEQSQYNNPGKGEFRRACFKNNHNQRWADFPTQSPVCWGNDGLPHNLDGITLSKWRELSIKAYGNAIAPRVAYEIFKCIEAATIIYERKEINNRDNAT